MFSELLDTIKRPITTTIEKSENEDLKRGCIKLAIISAIMSLITVISSIKSIFSTYSKKSIWYSSYSSSELWEKRWKAIKNEELFSSFFKDWAVFAVILAVSALVLFIIAKLLKNDKEYSSTLSIINNSFIFYLIGAVIGGILGLIYSPLGWIATFATLSYVSLTMLLSFRESLDLEDSNGYVLVTTGVTVVVVVIIIILLSAILKTSLSDISDLLRLLGI